MPLSEPRQPTRFALDCARCPVANQAACAVLSQAEKEGLARLGSGKIVQRGAVIFAAGSAETACATLLSGMLKVVRHDRDGTEAIVALIHPAGFTGELFSPFQEYDVVALTASRLCVFIRSDFKAAVARHPALANALLQRASDDLSEARRLIALTGHKKAAARLAGLILDFANAASKSPCHPADTIDIPLPRADMANMLGLTIETVSRQMTRLFASGVITRTGPRSLHINDLERLKVIAD